MAQDKQLRMTFDPQTIEHLGVKMYSQIPSAIAELVANSYDADAKSVSINLVDSGGEKSIELTDDGVGMNFEEVNEKFLRIGRNRRKEGAGASPGGRIATGKKGLGKLSLFGLADLIEITTKKADSETAVNLILSWEDLRATKGQDYLPKYHEEKRAADVHGTVVELRKLRRESPFDAEGLAISLSMLFNCFGKDFRCQITQNGKNPIEVNNELRFKNIEAQFRWEFPEFSNSVAGDYPHKSEITGEIISTPKPIRPNLRGITLFANGRQVNGPEFFGISESSHVFSYIAGWLNVNFVDDLNEDVISTNRQSLNWELVEPAALREFLVSVMRKLVVEWREKRKEAKKKEVDDIVNVDTQKWLGTMPEQVRKDVTALVQSVIDETDVTSEKQAEVIELVHKLVPEYPEYHWRHVHPEVRKVSAAAYENRDYYTAFSEAAKRYANLVRAQPGALKDDDHPLMGAMFGMEKGIAKKLSVTKGFKRPDGSEFNSQTLENIENGQRELSQGVIRGCRNPVAHEEHVDLRDSNLFSEKDCLDALSILSHLFRRLDDAIKGGKS